MRLSLALLLLLALLGGCSRSGPQPVKVIVGATLMDGTGRPPVADAVVVVVDSLIFDLGDAASVKIPAQATVFQARGKYVFPSDLNQPLARGGPADLLIVDVNPALDPGYEKKTHGRMRLGRWIQYPY